MAIQYWCTAEEREFHYAKPDILTKLVNIYATSFYGSGLWNLSSPECQKLYASWNVTIRQIFNLDRCTHRYLIEPVSQCLHPKVMLASRYTTFVKSLTTSKKFTVRFLVRLFQNDLRTVMGQTLRSLVDQCGLTDVEDLSASTVKKNCNFFPMPDAEQWRAPMLRELISSRDGQLVIENFASEEIKDLIDHLCVS